MKWLDAILGPVIIFNLFTYVICEHLNARWLPWYRRYASVLIQLLYIVLYFTGRSRAATWFALASVAVSIWNANTAGKNRRDGKDQRKAEAAAAEQTAVQAAAWRREVADAQ